MGIPRLHKAKEIRLRLPDSADEPEGGGLKSYRTPPAPGK